MPLYTFKCSSCGREFELLQSAEVTQVQKCPSCASVKTAKQIPHPAPPVVKQRNRAEGGCCGSQSPCDNPKRCCGK
jgi:putative FmdB family regulatory protein